MSLEFKDFEFNDKESIYVQIINLIKSNIALGNLSAGDKLPSVRELASNLGVNPNTLQRAYLELERQGVTYSKRGLGSFISEKNNDLDTLKEDMGKEIALRFLKEMKGIGIEKSEAINILKNMEGD